MNNRLGVLLLLVGASAAQPAFAGDSATMKCDASHDRVWVYDSLTTFDVAAKLKCGEAVEITGRVKGYVKIHAANGTEGYVPDSTFPGLPPYVDPDAAATDTISLAKKIAARPATHTPVVATTTPVATVIPPAPAVPTETATATAAPVAPKPAPNVVAVAQVPPAPAVNVASVTKPSPAPAVASVPSPALAPSSMPSHVAPEPARGASAPAPEVRTVAATKPAPTESASMTIEPMPTDAPAPAPATITTAAATTGARSASTPAPGKKSNASAHTSASSTSMNSASATTKSSSPAASGKSASTKSATTQPQPSGSAHPAPTPSVPTPAATTSSHATESSASAQPPHEAASVHTVAATSATDPDEDPGYLPENASADPACRTFFSAYGLAPSQAKWIAQNRKKQFSSVCPAPDPSKVDFVIIFTHDVDFFGSTLPSEIHRDQHGFSDFSPMTMIDSALVPQSEADKAHREYVWVFKMQRGAFDPSKFSPRRHPQFSKAEQHAPARTVEEAFQFIESGGAGPVSQTSSHTSNPVN